MTAAINNEMLRPASISGCLLHSARCRGYLAVMTGDCPDSSDKQNSPVAIVQAQMRRLYTCSLIPLNALIVCEAIFLSLE
jgi:hypothetical protein